MNIKHEQEKFDRERRRLERDERRYERLGSDPRCYVCGEDDARCLERHHIAGEANGATVITTCRNCHRKLSDQQYDWPDGLLQGGVGTQQDRLRSHLHGIADLEEETGRERARLLREVALMLDTSDTKGR